MPENQWPRNPVLTFWQSKRICSDNALKSALVDHLVDIGVNEPGCLNCLIRKFHSNNDIGEGAGKPVDIAARAGGADLVSAALSATS
jgi:hypothetical protein